MADFTQLKNYLNESKPSTSGSTASLFSKSSSTVNLSSSVTSGLSNMKDSVFGFMGKRPSASGSSSTANLDTDQTESWFREADSDPWCPKLSKTQRIIGFMTCLLLGAFCMFMATFYIPVILLKSRKFVLLFSLGSLFFILSFSILWGFKSHMKHLMNSARLPFTLAYFFTLFGTIYYAMIVKSVAITLIFAVLQMGTLVWYVISYIPGGQTGLKFFAKLFYTLTKKTVQTTLSV